jgi:hypothetical protein
MCQIKGTIKLIKPTEQVSEKFTKREFVVTTTESYPQDIAIQFVKDKCSELDKFSVGKSVEVDVNIRGNEHNDRYFINLQAWRIKEVANGLPPQVTAPSGPVATASGGDDDDTLPF